MLMKRLNVIKDVAEDKVHKFAALGYEPVGAPAKTPKKPVETVSAVADKVPAKEPEQGTAYSREELAGMTVKKLKAIAKEMGIQMYSSMDKATLVEVILAY